VHEVFEKADANHDGMLSEKEFGALRTDPDAQSVIGVSLHFGCPPIVSASRSHPKHHVHLKTP